MNLWKQFGIVLFLMSLTLTPISICAEETREESTACTETCPLENVECMTGADCVDDDPCTRDHCVQGTCSHSPARFAACLKNGVDEKEQILNPHKDLKGRNLF